MPYYLEEYPGMPGSPIALLKEAKMSLQKTFDACTNALLSKASWPLGESRSAKQIVLEFLHMQRVMDPRVWRAEILDLAADYELDTEKFLLLWESSHRETFAKFGVQT